MFSKRLFYTVRYYSASTEALQLWIKYSSNPAVRIRVSESDIVDDLAEKVEKRLKTKTNVSLFTCLEQEPLRNDLKLKDLSETDLKNNSLDEPLFAQTPTKTIYVRDIDNDGWETKEFTKYKVLGNEALHLLLKNSSGLTLVSTPNTRIAEFNELKDGELYYRPLVKIESPIGQKKYSYYSSMILTMTEFLKKTLGTNTKTIKRWFLNSEGIMLQEWDGALLADDTLYLLHVAQILEDVHLEKLEEKIQYFPEILENSLQKKLKTKFSKIVGVACGMNIRNETILKAQEKGFLAILAQYGNLKELKVYFPRRDSK